MSSARDDPDHVYVSRLDAIVYTYNQPMGSSTLSRQGADGATLWSVELGDTVQVESIASDNNGTVVVGGRYFRQLRVDGSPVLSVPSGHVSAGSFLCAWNASGQVLWQMDVSGGPFDDRRVSAIALDPQGRFWAALNTFFEADIVRLNTDGTQAESRTIIDSKLIGGISFDPWGGLYVAGAGESPDITVNGTQFAVPHNYAFFVTRMNAAGVAQWVRSAADISFQEPVVQADASGHAYLLGTYYQPLTWEPFLSRTRSGTRVSSSPGWIVWARSIGHLATVHAGFRSVQHSERRSARCGWRRQHLRTGQRERYAGLGERHRHRFRTRHQRSFRWAHELRSNGCAALGFVRWKWEYRSHVRAISCG